MYLIIMCACNHGPTNAYGAATEEEKDTNLRGSGESSRGDDRVWGRWEKKMLCSGYVWSDQIKTKKFKFKTHPGWKSTPGLHGYATERLRSSSWVMLKTGVGGASMQFSGKGLCPWQVCRTVQLPSCISPAGSPCLHGSPGHIPGELLCAWFIYSAPDLFPNQLLDLLQAVKTICLSSGWARSSSW